MGSEEDPLSDIGFSFSVNMLSKCALTPNFAESVL